MEAKRISRRRDDQKKKRRRRKRSVNWLWQQALVTPMKAVSMELAGWKPDWDGVRVE